MRQRNIFVSEVEEALDNGIIVEDYSESHPLPCYLILGHTKSGRPLHIVVALDAEDRMIWAITVYQPNNFEWNDDFTQRKKTDL